VSAISEFLARFPPFEALPAGDLGTIASRVEVRRYGLGENILVGPNTMSGGAMEDAWMNSPGHRANILSPNFDSIGIAVGWSPDGRIWATQNFGRYK